MADKTRIKKFSTVPYACLYIDASWRDVLAAISFSLEPEQQRSLMEYKLDRLWNSTHATPSPILPCLSVRTAFDLFLSVKKYPRGSEMVFCAVNIPDMARIVRHHGIKIVSLDLDVETMMPKVEDLKALITPRSVALLVAHLYGRRNNLDEIISVARSHYLDVLEDCAESFCGLQEHGHSRADVTFFSFGLIKTTTAFGGAIAVVRNPPLMHQMRTLYHAYPVHGRSTYLKKVLKYSMVMTAINSPFIVKNATLLLKALRIDHRNIIINAIRGFPSNFFENIRMRPSMTLLCMLYRRLKNFDADSYRMGNIKGDFVSQRLPHGFKGVGLKARNRNYWLFPVVVDDPERVVKELNARGVDAYRGATQLNLIESDVPFPRDPLSRTPQSREDPEGSGHDDSRTLGERRSSASTSSLQPNPTYSIGSVGAANSGRALDCNHKQGPGQDVLSAGSERRSLASTMSHQQNLTDSSESVRAGRSGKTLDCDHLQGHGQDDSRTLGERRSSASTSSLQPNPTDSSGSVGAARPGKALVCNHLQDPGQDDSRTMGERRSLASTSSLQPNPTYSSGSVGAARPGKALVCNHLQDPGQDDSRTHNERRSLASTTSLQPNLTDSAGTLNEAARSGKASSCVQSQGPGQDLLCAGKERRSLASTKSLQPNPRDSVGTLNEAAMAGKASSCDHKQGTGQDVLSAGSERRSLASTTSLQPNPRDSVGTLNEAAMEGKPSSCDYKQGTGQYASRPQQRTSADTLNCSQASVADNPACAFHSSITSQADEMNPERKSTYQSSNLDSINRSNPVPTYRLPIPVRSRKSLRYTSGNSSRSTSPKASRSTEEIPSRNTQSEPVSPSSSTTSSNTIPAQLGKSPEYNTGYSPSMTSGKYPHEARHLIDHVVYLPVHKRVPFHYLEQICAALEDVAGVLAKEKMVKDRSRL